MNWVNWTAPTDPLPHAPTPSARTDGPGVVTLRDEVAQTTHLRELIENLLAEPRQLGPDYQPIHRLSDDRLVAVKATGRGQPGSPLGDTLSLLGGARTLGLVERLDWAFRCLAFEDLAGRDDLDLHLTPEPEAFGTLCPPRLVTVWSAARRSLRVAAEFHSDAFTDLARLRNGLAEIREWGWKVVLTDLGDDADAWALAHEITPDIVQIDLARRSLADLDHAHEIRGRAADWNAAIMAIGVDSSAARSVALELGATTARGQIFGAPGALPAGPRQA